MHDTVILLMWVISAHFRAIIRPIYQITCKKLHNRLYNLSARNLFFYVFVNYKAGEKRVRWVKQCKIKLVINVNEIYEMVLSLSHSLSIYINIYFIYIDLYIYVINEQCTYRSMFGSQSHTDATVLRMLTRAVHCTYKYVQLRHWFPFCRKVAEFMNFERTSSVANSVMHWRIRTFFRCVSGPTIYSPQ